MHKGDIIHVALHTIIIPFFMTVRVKAGTHLQRKCNRMSQLTWYCEKITPILNMLFAGL